MTDLLKAGLATLRQWRKAHMTVSATYNRSDASVALSATVGKSRHRISQSYGSFTNVVVRDYLFDTVDLILSGAATLPEAGDRIEEVGDDGKTYVYEVMSPGGDVPEWEYSDGHRGTLRVHTKHVETRDA